LLKQKWKITICNDAATILHLARTYGRNITGEKQNALYANLKEPQT